MGARLGSCTWSWLAVKVVQITTASGYAAGSVAAVYDAGYAADRVAAANPLCRSMAGYPSCLYAISKP